MGINVSIGAGGNVVSGGESGYKMDEGPTLPDINANLSRSFPNLDKLCAVTKFSRKELQTLYRSFKQECPMGKIDKAAFCDIFSKFFPQGNPTQYASLVFDQFDSNRCGVITFQDLVSNLSVLSRGSIREKLLWVFQLYDTDQDGVISLSDLTNILTSIYQILDPHTKNSLLSHRSSADVGLTSSLLPQNIKHTTISSTPDEYTSNEDNTLRKISISFSPTNPPIKTISKDADLNTPSKYTNQKHDRPSSEGNRGRRKISIASIRRFSARPSQDHITLNSIISQHANQLFKQMDAKTDGLIDSEEFIDFCVQDCAIVEAIDSLGSTFYLC